METKNRSLAVLNRDVIKYIAMFTMLLNHIVHSHVFALSPLVSIVFEDIGYFTAPVMCFFMVEGFQYTRSRWKYGARLFVFALISQIPYELAFRWGQANMIFTLFLCFLILVAMDKIENTFLCTVVCTLLVMISAVSDWAFLAPVLTILLRQSGTSRKKMAASYGVVCVVFVLLNMGNLTVQPGNPSWSVVCQAAGTGIGILAAAFTVLVLYNGKRMEHGKNFSKWFFYIFYPAHLLVLYWLKTFVFV
ncbi:MAG: conjugal transfer protein TraX [Lachnospiraceae bacterium]|nr:conjugal transfer protein TraX [Lachnospiraceae bacterium]